MAHTYLTKCQQCWLFSPISSYIWNECNLMARKSKLLGNIILTLGNIIFTSVGQFCWHFPILYLVSLLTHWGRVTHICVSDLTSIGSDNGLSPGRRQAIIRTNAGILLIRPLGTNFSEILIGIQTFSSKKIHLKMSSAKWCPFVSASMC